MAFTRETLQQTSHTGGPETSISTSAFNLAAGRVVVVIAKWETGAGTCTVGPDTAGNNYVSRGKGVDTPDGMFMEIFDCLNTAANAANVITATVPAGSTFLNIVALPYSHTGTASLKAAMTPTGPSASSTATGTSMLAGDMAVFGVAEFTGTTTTATAGWTEQTDVSANGSHSFDRIDSPGGSFTPTATLATSATWITVGASYLDTASGTPIPLMGQACL
jgi:hypothetical protein